MRQMPCRMRQSQDREKRLRYGRGGEWVSTAVIGRTSRCNAGDKRANLDLCLTRIDIKLDKAAIERRPTDTQPSGGLRPIAFGIGKRREKSRFLVPVRQGDPHGRTWHNGGTDDLRREINRKNLFCLAADHRKFDGTLQFTHITGPCVAHEKPMGVGIQALDSLSRGGADLPKK